MIYQLISSNGKTYEYYEFLDNSSIEYYNNVIENNGVFEACNASTSERSANCWDDIDFSIAEIGDDDYVKVSSILFLGEPYMKREDAYTIKKFYEERNDRRRRENKTVRSYVNEQYLEMAENLINIIEENILLNYKVLGALHYMYSNVTIPTRNNDEEIWEIRDIACPRIFIRKDERGLKGKKLKDVQKYNLHINSVFEQVCRVIDNFVEIIMEEQSVKDYIAKAVAWECIQEKAIQYYANIWEEEYDSKLPISFSEALIQYEFCDDVENEYISDVLLCEDIDIEQSKEFLIYFLIKYRYQNIHTLFLFDIFREYYKEINEIQQRIEESDIKEKLKTKQKRKIAKYTIDDVDLMNGAEFEEFVCLLFKNMGYASKVTQQSGDQGIDVVATRNGTKIGIQAKCYSNTVGNSAVQEAVAGKIFYGCDKVMVITNNYFTSSAIELANVNNVVLWNRDMLKEKIKERM